MKKKAVAIAFKRPGTPQAWFAFCRSGTIRAQIVMVSHTRHITGVVLAGGKGRRMGGCDKGLLSLNGKQMIEHVLQLLAPQVDELLINANRNQEQYAQFGYPVVCDDMDNYQGPLAGIAAALRHCTSEYILTVPCDSPLLPTQLAERLYQQAQQTGATITCAHDGIRLQPVFALIHASLLPNLLDYLRSGERKIDRWYQRHSFASVDFSDTLEAFSNINTDQERSKLESLLAATKSSTTHPGTGNGSAP